MYGKSGAVIIFYRKYLQVKTIKLPKECPSYAYTEILSLEIIKQNTSITLIYRHHKGNVDHFLSHIEKVFCNRKNLDKINIFCRDININRLKDNKKPVHIDPFLHF